MRRACASVRVIFMGVTAELDAAVEAAKVHAFKVTHIATSGTADKAIAFLERAPSNKRTWLTVRRALLRS